MAFAPSSDFFSNKFKEDLQKMYDLKGIIKVEPIDFTSIQKKQNARIVADLVSSPDLKHKKQEKTLDVASKSKKGRLGEKTGESK